MHCSKGYCTKFIKLNIKAKKKNKSHPLLSYLPNAIHESCKDNWLVNALQQLNQFSFDIVFAQIFGFAWQGFNFYETNELIIVSVDLPSYRFKKFTLAIILKLIMIYYFKISTVKPVLTATSE